MTSFFRRVTKYPPSAQADPGENRLTEAFAATLADSAGLGADLVAEWLDGLDKPEGPLRVRTQRATVSGGIVDLELRFGPTEVPDLLVWVEVKHSAPVEPGQLEKYAADIQHDAATERRLVVLAPRESLPMTGRSAVPIEWQQIATFLRQWRKPRALDSVARFLVDQFLDYLEEEGLTDAEALTAAHAFALAARPQTDRTVVSLNQFAFAYVAKHWGDPIDFAKASRGRKPNYGAAWWWATYEVVRAKAKRPTAWRNTVFEWCLRPDTPRDQTHDAYAYVAGATFLKADNPLSVPGNEVWLAARAGERFERVTDYHTRLWQYLYPEQLLVESSLDAQGEALGRWIVKAFETLAASPPPK